MRKFNGVEGIRMHVKRARGDLYVAFDNVKRRDGGVREATAEGSSDGASSVVRR